MSNTVLTRTKLSARTYTFVRKVITPVVLLAGLIVLAVLNFRGVLATTTLQDNLFHGEKAYSQGPMQFTYQELAGTQRPDIAYRGASILTYVEWSSTISVDGHVSNLWDSYHGYDFDRTNPNARQFFATSSGPGWQLVQVVTLVDAHTVTVHYDFVARAQGSAYPHQITLTIEHLHNTLYQPALHGATLTAGVLPGLLQTIAPGTSPKPIGWITLAVAGPAVPSGPIAIDDLHGTVGANGAPQSLANSFTTTYQLANPQVNRLTPLGTETITFSLATPIGAPLGAPVTPVATPR